MQQDIILMIAIVFIFFFFVRGCTIKQTEETFKNSIGQAPEYLLKSVSYKETDSNSIEPENYYNYEKPADFGSEYTDLTNYFTIPVKN